MPAWFSKIFKTESPAIQVSSKAPEVAYSAALAAPAAPSSARRSEPKPIRMPDEEVEASPGARRVIEPTILHDEAVAAPAKSEIRIKVRMEKDGNTFVFMVDRPILERYSAWFPVPEAAAESPLAHAVFGVEGTDSVMIHGMNLTVTRDPLKREPWEPWAQEIGTRVRAHLSSDKPAVTPEFTRQIPSEDDIQDRLETVIHTEINPGIASHSGAISLERIEGNTVFIRMMGGCQGCAASTITLRQGIHQAFREAVPQLGAILDQTDHTAGANPYYRQLPDGMRADA